MKKFNFHMFNKVIGTSDLCFWGNLSMYGNKN